MSILNIKYEAIKLRDKNFSLLKCAKVLYYDTKFQKLSTKMMIHWIRKYKKNKIMKQQNPQTFYVLKKHWQYEDKMTNLGENMSKCITKGWSLFNVLSVSGNH